MGNQLNSISFEKPEVKINFNMSEQQFIELLKVDRSENGFYTFDAKMENLDCELFVRVNFDKDCLKMELCIFDENLKRTENIIRVNLDKTNVLKEYTLKTLGQPTCLSSMFSAINKPFYIYKWKFKDLRVIHKYQDSVGGIYESLIFETK